MPQSLVLRSLLQRLRHSTAIRRVLLSLAYLYRLYSNRPIYNPPIKLKIST